MLSLKILRLLKLFCEKNTLFDNYFSTKYSKFEINISLNINAIFSDNKILLFTYTIFVANNWSFIDEI